MVSHGSSRISNVSEQVVSRPQELFIGPQPVVVFVGAGISVGEPSTRAAGKFKAAWSGFRALSWRRWQAFGLVPLLAVMLVGSLVGCNNDNGGSNNSPASTPPRAPTEPPATATAIPSPERIAFTDYRSDRPSIYVMNADGTGETILFSDGSSVSPRGTIRAV